MKYLKKQLCQTHYHRLWRGKDLGDDKSQVRRYSTSICAAEGCAEDRKHGAYCYKHGARVARHGSPDIVLTPTVHSGASHPFWTGDEASYSAMHQRVRKAKGRAAEHLCACGAQARQWSYDRQDPDERQAPEGPYSVSVDHYVARCVPCHKRFDLDAIAVLSP